MSNQTTNVSRNPIRFKELSGWNDKTKLPVLSLRFPLPSPIDKESVNITYTYKASAFTHPTEISYLSAILPEDINILKTHLVTINKNPYLELEITPIIYDSEKELFNKIEQIKLQIDLHNETKTRTLKSSKLLSNNSVLAEGKWIKIKITESGIHKIPYTSLLKWGFNDPTRVNVFGNGGNMLAKHNKEPRLNDLTENAIMHHNNSIYFYAQGPTTWSFNEGNDMFEHKLHQNSDYAYYFLSDNNGSSKRIESSTNLSNTFTQETDLYDSYQFHELENQNLLRSGSEWYGLRFSAGQERKYSFEFPNCNTSHPIKILTRIIGRSNSQNNFTSYINSSVDAQQTITVPPVEINSATGSFAKSGISKIEYYTNSKLININLRYNALNSGSSGWLDFICLNAKERLILDDQLSFRNISITGKDQTTRFYLDGTKSTTILWDITNHTSPKSIKIDTYGTKHGFTYQTSDLREFIVFNTDAALPQPEYESTVQNQNLHHASVPDMLIVTHPLFRDEAERLAEIHNTNSGLKCLVVEPEQIYNEFSSGSSDVCAIRDFARHLYLKGNNFKYLLLFGDGSYDNKTNDDTNTNFILTYQSKNSLDISESYTSDDFFACLDDNEGKNILYDKIDIGVGRLPVSTIEHAKAVVDKIDTYLNDSEAGPWKTEITFVADDNQNNENNIHIADAEELSQTVYANHPAFNHNKIYLDSYTKVVTSTGGQYPEVNNAIKEQLEEGTLIFNYTGHGNEKTLAHEQVVTIDDIKQLTNLKKLPVFITATCEFSRYDEYQLISAGEWVLLSPNGGAIALFTTTRIAWSNFNSEINNSFYQHIFNKDDNGNKLRLGDVIKHTKNNSINSVNKLSFTLLGDPALELQYPDQSIQTTHVNGIENESDRKPLEAKSIAGIQGKINNNSSNSSTQTLHIQVFDKPIKVKTKGNGGYTPFEYQLYSNKIFNGVLDVTDNHFLSSFMVPYDIRLNIDKGRISYYAYDANGNEAFGADNSILIGGISNTDVNDNIGPDIKLWLNDESFKNGDITGSQPILFAKIQDKSGINISGIGIGHDITLVIDNNRSLPINLNKYYTADRNSYQGGTLQYQLPQLKSGKHTIELKTWDNLNNSSVAQLEFQVHLGGVLNLSDIKVYPNPIEPGGITKLTFVHDAPNLILDLTLRLYNTSGQLIKQTHKTQPAIGTTVTPIEWPIGILEKGIYILQGEIQCSENQIGKFSKKILVIK